MSDLATGSKRRRPSYLGEDLEAGLEIVQNLPPTDTVINETNDDILNTLYTGAIALGEATDQQDQIPAIEAAFAARKARSVEEIEAAGIATDPASMTVLIQSIANGIGNDPRRQPPVACQPGTLFAWTKYFQNVAHPDNEDEDMSGLHPAKRPRMDMDTMAGPSSHPRLFDLLSSVASCPDLLLQICAYLRPADIMVLYRVSRVFKATIDADLAGNSARLARLYVPESLAVFPWALYGGKTSLLGDPMSPPTLRYFAMLVSRERKVRDIIACLARAGHRLPQPGARLTLKKMWLLLDAATTLARQELIKHVFTDDDLLMMQLFCTRIVLYLHEPLFSEGSMAAPTWANMHSSSFVNTTSTATFAHVLLGQRGGLDRLWQLMRGRALTTVREIVELKVRYDYRPQILPRLEQLQEDRRLMAEYTGSGPDGPPVWLFIPDTAPELPHRNFSPNNIVVAAIHTVPFWDMGAGCLEGWGTGTKFLLRPDQLLPAEAARRGLDLAAHTPFMAVWGYRDFATGRNLVPTLEELYMSDDDDDDDDEQERVEPAAETTSTNTKLPVPPSSPPKDSEASLEQDVLANLLQSHRREVDAAQTRLADLCGNVRCGSDEWQPWQVLKAQWPDLTLQEKIDVWWMCQQERLKLQPWMMEGENNDDQSLAEVQSVSDADEEDHDREYMMGRNEHENHENHENNEALPSDQPTQAQENENGNGNGDGDHEVTMEDVLRDLDELDYLDGYDSDADSDLFVLDDHPVWEVLDGNLGSNNVISYPRLLHHHHRRPRRFRNARNTHSAHSAPRAYPPSGEQGLAAALLPSALATTSGMTLGEVPVTPSSLTPGRSGHAPLRVSSHGTITASSRSFSLRHRRLMAACVQSALQQQAAADATLMAQADGPYEDDELEWWEQQLEAMEAEEAMEALETMEAEEAQDNHDLLMELDLDMPSPVPSTAASTAGSTVGSTNPQQAFPTEEDTAVRPELVQLPSFGGDEDVVELLDLLVNAEAAAAAAAMGVIATDDGGDGLADRVQSLKEVLESRLKAEVFAVDLPEI